MGHRVLVVDDDRINLLLVENALKKAGIEVLTAPDGQKGLDLAHTSSPHVILIDLLIPKIHGLELCSRIKEDSTLQGITVVIMSAVYKHPMYAKDINNSGADHFFEKPLDLPKLMALIQGVLSSKENELHI